jgi:hypothetical protein
MKKPAYVDLHSLTEDQRIDMIGELVMKHNQSSAFVVEDKEKADRYMTKLKAKYPGIVELLRFPLAGQVAVKVGPPVHTN